MFKLKPDRSFLSAFAASPGDAYGSEPRLRLGLPLYVGRTRTLLASGARRYGASVMRRLLAFDIFTPRWGYVFRVVLAAALALWLAYYLQLETPYSAATTVFLSASPVQGVTLSKGMWRVTGTILGALVTLVLFALFSQAPALFIFGFALWLGVCVGLSSLLRHFRAYGAVVAGYTIGLAAYGAIDQPDQIFEHAVGRVSVVALGVISLGLVTALFSQRATAAKLQARLVQLTKAVGTLAADSLESDARELTSRRQGLIGDIYGLDDLLEFGATESAELAARAVAVRHAMASLFAVVVGCARLEAAAGSVNRDVRVLVGTAMLDAVAMLGVTEQSAGNACEKIDDARRRLRIAQDASDERAHPSFAAYVIAIDRLDEVLEDYQAAIMGLMRLQAADVRLHPPRFRFHLDLSGGLDNGARAAFAILLAGALWIATGWTSAFLMILLIAPFCGLLAMTGNPVAGSVEFTKGIAIAVVAGFICSFGILPHVSGFPLLIAALAPFWIAGLFATTVPRTAPAGTAYLLTFMTMVGPTNPMAYDVAGYLNSGFAFVLSGIFTLLSFRLFLPRDPVRQARRISGAIESDALAVLRRAPGIRRLAWQHRQHQRLALLAMQLRGNGGLLTTALDDGVAAIHLGRAAFGIREMLAGETVWTASDRVARGGLAALRIYHDHKAGIANAARRTADELCKLDQISPGSAQQALLLAARFRDIADLLDARTEFFDRKGR